MFKKLKDKFFYYLSLKFIQDVFTLQISSILGTGLSIIASVVFARILGAETYGNYALIFAFTGLIGLFMDWGVGYATLTLLSEAYARNDRQEMKNILTYYFKLSFFISIIGLMAIAVSPYLAELLYHNSQIGDFARLVILASIIRIFLSLIIILLQVLRKIKYLAVVENLNDLFINLFPIIFVLLGFGLWGIVSGQFLTAVGFFFFSYWLYHKFSQRNQLVPSFSEVIKNFKHLKIFRYFKFGFAVGIDKNINNLISILPIVFMGMLGTPEQVANVKISLAYLALPKIFLGPIGRLLQVQLPKAKVAGFLDLKRNFYKSSIMTGFVYLFMVLATLVVAPFFIRIFYGQGFELSIKLVYPLSLSVIFSGFMVAYSSLYRTINKMKSSILISSAVLVSGLIIFIISLGLTSPLKSIIILIIVWSFLNLFFHYLYIRRQLKTAVN